MDKFHLAPGGHGHDNRVRGSSVGHEHHVDDTHEEFFSTHLPSRPVSAMGQERDAQHHHNAAAPRRPHKIVLCFDGTGNKFHGDDSDSNILKIYRMLDRTASDQCKPFWHCRGD